VIQPKSIDFLRGMNIAHVSSGMQHSLVVRDNGTVYSFGNNAVFIYSTNYRMVNCVWVTRQFDFHQLKFCGLPQLK
jgi:alpha-tubulin suppressor-like RCC1 family protein